MKKVIEFLQGKKTNIIAFIGALYAVLEAFNLINFTVEQKETLAVLGLSALGFALHDAIIKK